MYENLKPSAADFTNLANVNVIAYRIVRIPGTKLAVVFFKFQGDVTVAAQDLKVKLDDGMIADGFGLNTVVINDGTQVIGQVYTAEGWDYLVFRKAPGTFWTLGTNVFLEGQLTIELK